MIFNPLDTALKYFWQDLPAPLQANNNLVVAVSGGTDSLALLHALLKFAPTQNPPLHIIVAHLNHLIRGEAANADAVFVQHYCETQGVPYQTVEYDVPAFASRASLSIEEAARQVRYAFLGQIAVQNSARLVLTAHHANDQAETVLMRFLRGAGGAGLAGISPLALLPPILSPELQAHFGGLPAKSEMWLGRPFLQVSRATIEEYCLNQALNPRQDSTNTDPTYTRNRVRLELLPLLESEYQPGVSHNLGRLADIFRAEEAWLEQLVQAEFDKQTQIRLAPLAEVSFNLANFSGLPVALQRRLIRQAVRHLHGNLHNLEQQHIEQSRLLFNGRGGDRLHLPGGIVAFRQRERVGLLLSEATPANKLAEGMALTVPGELLIEEYGAVLRAEWVTITDVASTIAEQKVASPYTALLDADKLGDSLLVRSRRAGDVFQPLGAPGKRKLQDVLVDAHILREQRHRLPLLIALYSDGNTPTENIIWVPGVAIAQGYQLTPGTRHALKLLLTSQVAP